MHIWKPKYVDRFYPINWMSFEMYSLTDWAT